MQGLVGVAAVNGALLAACFGALLWRMGRAEREITRLRDDVAELTKTLLIVGPQRVARNEAQIDRLDTEVDHLREAVATLSAILQTSRGQHLRGEYS